MASTMKNPVERKLTDLELMWLEATEDSVPRLYIWRTPQDSDRLIHGFFALQQQPQNDYTVPDLFVNFQAPFETGYNYCQQIAQELIERYEVTETPDQRWEYADLLPCYSINSLMTLLESFAAYYKEGFRYLTLILTPKHISDTQAFTRYINELLENPIAESVRVILTDTFESNYWQALQEQYPAEVKTLDIELDEDELMRQILNESPTSDGAAALRFRQLMVDTFTTMKKGTAEQVEKRAQQALQIAKDNSWFDQKVVMYSMIAGGYLKETKILKAVKNYQLAQQAATHVQPESPQNLLITQSLLGEGGAWYLGKDYIKAAEAYSKAADTAQKIPNPLWVIEGYRVAGSSLVAGDEHLKQAIIYYRKSIIAGIELPVDERMQTTFMFAFQDLMRIVDNKRVDKLIKLEENYQKQQAKLIQVVETKAKSLGEKPTAEQIAKCDQELEQELEQLFYNILQQRENIVASANSCFIDIVKLARLYGHPYWSCSQDLAHPFDLPREEWRDLKKYIEPFQQPITEESLTKLIAEVIGVAPYNEEVIT